MIIIEGIIGAGKTTLAKKIEIMLPKAKLFLEPVDENPYLEKFYQNPAKCALEMQFWLMANCYKMHIEAIDQEWKKGIISIFDRSIYGNVAFASLLCNDGIISKQGYLTYLAMRDMMERTLLLPHLVIYLDVSIEVAQERIMERGRDCEKNIPNNYQKKLDKAYRDIVLPQLAISTLVKIIPWNNPKQYIKKVINLVQGSVITHRGI